MCLWVIISVIVGSNAFWVGIKDPNKFITRESQLLCSLSSRQKLVLVSNKRKSLRSIL